MSRNITEFLNSRSESVKLKAEKIELGLAQDLQKKYGEIISSGTSIRQEELAVRKKYEAVSKEMKALGDDINKAWKMAKDLGVDDSEFKRLSSQADRDWRSLAASAKA